MQTPFIALEGGNYIARVALCANTESGSADTDTTSVYILENGTIVASATTLSSRSAEIVDVPFFIRAGKTAEVWVVSNVIGLGFSVSQIEIFKTDEFVSTVNYGKHVILGDSCVAEDWLVPRIVARLDKAAIVNAGVAGNEISDMVARFATDVAPESPQFVWVVSTGANDYVGGNATSTYDLNIGKLAGLVAALGADCVLFGAAVGPLNHSTAGDTLTGSREYVLNTKLGAALPTPNASSQASPSNPTAISGSTMKMAGVGGTCKLTPSRSGRVRLRFQGTISPSLSGAIGSVQARYGSGTAPANGDAVAGTALGSAIQVAVGSANAYFPFSAGGIIAGLTPGTPYWFDVSASVVGGGTVTVLNLSCDAEEF
jgi:hypothetical protein